MANNREDSLSVDRLREAIRDRKAGFVIGAGVSMSAANKEVATWRGLLHDGIRRCGRDKKLGAAFVERWSPIVEHGQLDEILAAGDVVSAVLRDSDEFGTWLGDTVGNLRIVDHTLLRVIARFELPIATTNYDCLLEEETGWKTISIRDGLSVAAVGDALKVIIHLHGHYGDENSIVLGTQSYQEFLTNPKYSLRQLLVLGQMRTLVFVGFGAGMRDPNFSLLLRRLADIFEGSSAWHYQLVPDDQVEAAEAALEKKGHIRVLGYGPNYADLPVFLEALRPTVTSRAGKHRAEPPPVRPINEDGEYYKRFVGREPALAAVRSAVNVTLARGTAEALPPAPRLFWIHGFGGMGKTTFLRHVSIVIERDYGGLTAVALIDWEPNSRRLSPLNATPVTPEDMFKPIAERVAQCYGADVLELYWSALENVQRYHQQHLDLHFRFSGALAVLEAHGPDWRRNVAGFSPEIQDALREDSVQRDVHTLERALRSRNLWSDDVDVLKRNLRELKKNLAAFADVMGSWRALTLGPDADEALVSPTSVLAEGLRASLELACQRRPLALVLDSCERLSLENDRWLRSIVAQLLARDAALLVVIASESKPDAREPLGARDTWRSQIPPGYWHMEPFDETRLFTLEEVERVLKLSGVQATPRLVEVLHTVTRGVPLALTVVLNIHKEDPTVFDELVPARDQDEDPDDRSGVVRKVIGAVSQRFLLQLQSNPESADDFQAIIAVAIQRLPNIELLRALWRTDPDARLESLEGRYAVFKGKELHETVRSFVRLRWRDSPPLELAEIARRSRELYRDLRPALRAGEEHAKDYAAWLVEDLNLALWESLEAGMRLFPGRLAGILVLNSGADALDELVQELRTTPRAPRETLDALQRILDANRSALDTAIHLDVSDVTWFDESIDDSSSAFEIASRDLLAGLVMWDASGNDQETNRMVRERLDAAIRYFKPALPRATQVVRAYGYAVAATSSRSMDKAVAQSLKLLRDNGLIAELDLRVHAALLLYSGDVGGAVATWTAAMGEAPTAADYRTLGHIHCDYGGEAHYGAAEAAFRRATELEPKGARNWTSWAALEFRRGNTARAKSLLAKTARCPDRRADPDGLNRVAWAMYITKGDLAAAERYARTAYELSSDDIHILHTLVAIELERDNWKDGSEHLRHMLESESPSAPRLYWSSIYGTVGAALRTHSADVLALLWSLENAEDWKDFSTAAAAVVSRNKRNGTRPAPEGAAEVEHYRELLKTVTKKTETRPRAAHARRTRRRET